MVLFFENLVPFSTHLGSGHSLPLSIKYFLPAPLGKLGLMDHKTKTKFCQFD